MALPKPHQRPRIDLSDNRPKDWQFMPSFKLAAGDIVPDRGLIVSVSVAEGRVLATFQSGVSMVYNVNEQVRAFGFTR